jgi:HEPN domain-containing protein
MKETNNWFEFAEDDLKMAEAALKGKIYNQTCFHSQQGVEKMLKGFLRTHGKSIPKTHFLDDLLNLCIEIDNSFSGLKEKCLKLDKYYIPTRYPDALPGTLPEGLPEKKDAQEALSFLREITDFVKGQVLYE